MNTTGVRPEALAWAICPLVCSSIVDIVGSPFSVSFGWSLANETAGVTVQRRPVLGSLLVHVDNYFEMAPASLGWGYASNLTVTKHNCRNRWRQSPGG